MPEAPATPRAPANERIDQLFAGALELPGEKRAAFLDGEEKDPAVRAEVAALLEAHQRAGSFLSVHCLDNPLSWVPWTVGGAGERLPEEALVGRRLGVWRLEKRLGVGGMGSVYLGARVDGEFDQRVAIKFADRALASTYLAERFAAERRILARLDHPGIARILDGGTTPDGLPYLVMELVEGLPIDRFCREGRLSLDRRLDLFLHALDAVDFAHRALVIHRDLKPAHVVVTSQGQVKLLDFGIAALLDPGVGPGHAAPGTKGDLAFTPGYASPEQLRGELLTTATDVYSLGVMLFKLLVGRLPRTIDPADTTTIEREPPPIVRQPLVDGPAGRLERLPHDLAAIVRKALDLEAANRYPSAAAFAEDLQRLRSGHAVLARRGTPWYRARRAIGRHRLPYALLALILVTLTAFTWHATRQARELQGERDRTRTEGRRAHAAASFLREILAEADAERTGGHDISVRQALDAGAERLRRHQDGSPVDRVIHLHTLGAIYRSMGDYEQSRAWLEEGLALARAGADRKGLAMLLYELGQWESEIGNVRQSELFHREALAIRREILPPTDPELFESRAGLARLLGWAGATAEQAALERETWELRQKMVGHAHPIALADQARYAVTLAELDRLKEACPLAEDALRRLDRVPKNSTDFLRLWPLGNTRRLCGDPAGAAEVLEALIPFAQTTPPNHFSEAFLRNDIAIAWMDLGRFDDTAANFEISLAMLMDRLGPRSQHTHVIRMNLAEIERMRGNFARAEALYRESRPYFHTERLRRTYADASIGLGAALLGLGRPAEARAELDQGLRLLRALRAPDHSLVLEAENIYGACLIALGQVAEGRQLRRQALENLARVLGPAHPRLRHARELVKPD